MALSLIINENAPKKDGLIADFLAGGIAPLQDFANGDAQVPVTVRTVVKSTTADRPWDDSYADGDVIRVGIGNSGVAATGGTFALTIDGESTGMTALDYNVTAAALESVLSTASVAGGNPAVEVTLMRTGVYRVDGSTNGVLPLISADESHLLPACQIIVSRPSAGSSTTKGRQYISIFQQPVALTQLTTALPAASVTVTTAQAATASVNEIKRIAFASGTYGGLYSLSATVSGVTETCGTVSPIASPAQLSLVLQNHSRLNADNISVTADGADYLVEFVGNLSLASPTLAATNVSLEAPTGLSGSLTINTDNLFDAFNETDADRLVFDFSVLRERGGITQTLLLVPVTIYRSVIDINNLVAIDTLDLDAYIRARAVCYDAAQTLTAGQKLQAVTNLGLNLTASKLLGQASSGGTGLPVAITLGSGLSMSGTTLSAAGGSGITVNTTTITGGTSGRILYDNAGTVGEATGINITGGAVTGINGNTISSGTGTLSLGTRTLSTTGLGNILFYAVATPNAPSFGTVGTNQVYGLTIGAGGGAVELIRVSDTGNSNGANDNAFGVGADAWGHGSAFGYNAKAGDTSHSTDKTNFYNCAFGWTCSVTGQSSVGVGSSLTTSAQLSVGVGHQVSLVPATPADDGSFVGVGWNATVTRNLGVAVGASTSVTGANGTAIGGNAVVTGANGIQIGEGTAAANKMRVWSYELLDNTTGKIPNARLDAVTSITGTANQITVTGTTTPTLSIPASPSLSGTVSISSTPKVKIDGGAGYTIYLHTAASSNTFAVTTDGSTALATVKSLAFWAASATASITVQGDNILYGKGSYSTTLAYTDPTASRTQTLQDATGTVALTSDITGGTRAASFTTLAASSTVTLSPANANVAISPTGTGTVTINPATASTINNCSIGQTTPLAGSFTSVSSTGDVTIVGSTGTVKTISFTNVGGGVYPGVGGAARISNPGGDCYWQFAGGMAAQTASYHEIVLQGGRGATTVPSFVAGATSTYNVRIQNTAASSIGLSIEGASSQSGNYINCTASGGSAGAIFNVNSAGTVTFAGALITTPQALTPALNAGITVSVATVATGFALNGTNAATLANGTNGQIKTIVCTAVTAAGTATLTPTTCTGFTTVAFTAAGQSLTLQYFTAGGWHILSVRGAVPA